jgi:hypothetical protein
MGQIKFLIAFAMIAVFTLAIVNYSIGFASDNSAPVSIYDNPNVSSLDSSLRGQMEEDYMSFNESDNSFQSSSIKSGDDNVEGGGSFKQVTNTQRTGFSSILRSIRVSIFGNDNKFLVVFNLFMGVIIVMGVLYIWKTWKGGTPD